MSVAQRLLLRGVHAGGGLVEQQEARRAWRARARSRAGAARRRAASRRAASAKRSSPSRARSCAGALVELAPRGARQPAAAQHVAQPASAARRPARRARCRARSARGRGGCSGTCARRRARRSGAGSRPPISRPSKRTRALGRRVDAGDHVEGGGLAGAVRADQRDERARLHARGRSSDDRREAAEADRQPLDLKERHAGSPRARSAARGTQLALAQQALRAAPAWSRSGAAE